MKNNIPKKLLFSEIEKIQKTLAVIKKKYLRNFDKLCFECLKTIQNNNKIIFYGNGGSASDELRSITSTGGGGVLLAGFSSSVASGFKTEGRIGSNDYWIIKINAN